MKVIKELVMALSVCAMVAVSTVGCHTIGGVGKDIGEGGRAIDNAADEVHEDIHYKDQSKIQNGYEQPGAHTVTAWADAGGMIDPSGSINGTHGSDQSFMISAFSGYHVADVLVDGKSTGARTRYTFDNMNANHTISAMFTVSPVK